MKLTRFRSALGLLTFLVTSPLVMAENYSHYQDRRVVIIKWGAEARSCGVTVHELALGRVYMVTDTDNGLLWLNGEAGGWVKATDVVLYEDADKHFDKAVQQKPSAQSYFNRAHFRLAKRDLEIAIEDFDEAIKRDPSKEAYFNGRGDAWRAGGDAERAIANYDEAIRLNPNYPNAYVNRAAANGRIRNYKECVDDCNTAVRLNPKYSYAYLTRGMAFGEIGDYGKAVADYQKTIRLDPEFSAAHQRLAWLFATCPEPQWRNGKDAVEHAMKSCELSNNFTEIILVNTLAAAYAEAGDFKMAIKWATTAKQLGRKENQAYLGDRLNAYLAHKPHRVTK